MIQLIREGQPGSDSYFTQDLAKNLRFLALYSDTLIL